MDLDPKQLARIFTRHLLDGCCQDNATCVAVQILISHGEDRDLHLRLETLLEGIWKELETLMEEDPDAYPQSRYDLIRTLLVRMDPDRLDIRIHKIVDELWMGILAELAQLDPDRIRPSLVRVLEERVQRRANGQGSDYPLIGIIKILSPDQVDLEKIWEKIGQKKDLGVQEGYQNPTYSFPYWYGYWSRRPVPLNLENWVRGLGYLTFLIREGWAFWVQVELTVFLETLVQMVQDRNPLAFGPLRFFLQILQKDPVWNSQIRQIAQVCLDPTRHFKDTRWDALQEQALLILLRPLGNEGPDPT